LGFCLNRGLALNQNKSITILFCVFGADSWIHCKILPDSTLCYSNDNSNSSFLENEAIQIRLWPLPDLNRNQYTELLESQQKMGLENLVVLVNKMLFLNPEVMRKVGRHLWRRHLRDLQDGWFLTSLWLAHYLGRTPTILCITKAKLRRFNCVLGEYHCGKLRPSDGGALFAFKTWITWKAGKAYVTNPFENLTPYFWWLYWMKLATALLEDGQFVSLTLVALWVKRSTIIDRFSPKSGKTFHLQNIAKRIIVKPLNATYIVLLLWTSEE